MIWPEDTAEHQKTHAFKHVKSLEFTIGFCKQRRTALQAGGNVGLWPIRLAKSFKRVITFEPEHETLKSLRANIAPFDNILLIETALGEAPGVCSMERRSLGSHRVIEGTDVFMITIDGLELNDVDLLQLDIEGYEIHALRGALETIKRTHPIIHLEMRNLAGNDSEILELMASLDYHKVPMKPGPDAVFRYVG